MKKSAKIAITAIAVGILMLTFPYVMGVRFEPIAYSVPLQYPITRMFPIRGSSIIPAFGTEISTNSYSYYFVEKFDVPKVNPEENITILTTYMDMWFGSDGPFRVYIFDAANFENWKAKEPCSTIWNVKPEEIGEIDYAANHHWFPISCLPNLYIVFENTKPYDIVLTVNADSLAWCQQITGYRTEYLTQYDYSPANARSFLLILAIMFITTGLIFGVYSSDAAIRMYIGKGQGS